MAKFLTELYIENINDTVWRLSDSLIYESDIIKQVIIVPVGFETDLASVPRIPIVYMLWGDRAHREAVIHDYLYRIDSQPVVSESTANDVFYEAMTVRGKPWYVRFPMKWGVSLGGFTAYHKLKVKDKLV